MQSVSYLKCESLTHEIALSILSGGNPDIYWLCYLHKHPPFIVFHCHGLMPQYTNLIKYDRTGTNKFSAASQVIILI